MCLIMKEDCIFCKIAKGEIHSATVYEDSHFTVILDVNPATKGHCLIIPKEHFDNILRDITNYDHYCAAHPEFENNVTKMTAQRIEEIYHRCLADNDFL